MSVVPITPDLIEVTTLLLQPSQSFSSSSSGLSGVIRLFSKPSPAILSLDEIKSGSVFSETSAITDDNDLLYSASQAYAAGETNINSFIEAYLAQVSASNVKSSQFLVTNPYRFTCPNSIKLYNSGSADDADVNFDGSEWVHLQRSVLRRRLIPEQRIENPLSFYSYVNYNCLNFVSSSTFGTASAIIYPNFDIGGTKRYTPDGPFTVDFFIKPKAPITETGMYKAGTIFHVSSSICISLVSGSALAQDQKPETFKILLQLSQSADAAPSTIDTTSLPLSSPNDLIFASDEVLLRDTWHRVTIRWGSTARSYGSGSIKVDDKIFSFCVNKPTIATKLSSDALFIGNYYNSGDLNVKFFNYPDSIIHGTDADPAGSTTDPVGFKFDHPLHAELHHISMFKRYLDDFELSSINDLYPLTASAGGPDFFVAPFFTSSIIADYRTYQTPTTLSTISTDSPVSYHLGAGYNATFLHLQNFIIDFANKKQPRPYGLTEGTAISTPFDSRTDSIDDLLMAQSVNRKRNFSIIPCDDGKFEPNFEILLSDSTRFHEVPGRIDPMLIDLEQFVPLNAYIPGYGFEDFEYDGTDGVFLPLFQNLNYLARVSDVNRSSNLITIFTIPSAYYQTRIIPETFILTDSNVSGSGGLSFKIRDDGRGNLYRADANSSHAKWNRIGAIFYGHGIAALISPHIPYFGKTGYEMTFRGETRKSILNISIPASPGFLNSSFNETYQDFPPTNYIAEQADKFTYITGINLHDSNFNVVMRARLAQATQKREGDEIVFRLRYDL